MQSNINSYLRYQQLLYLLEHDTTTHDFIVLWDWQVLVVAMTWNTSNLGKWYALWIRVALNAAASKAAMQNHMPKSTKLMHMRSEPSSLELIWVPGNWANPGDEILTSQHNFLNPTACPLPRTTFGSMIHLEINRIPEYVIHFEATLFGTPY